MSTFFHAPDLRTPGAGPAVTPVLLSRARRSRIGGLVVGMSAESERAAWIKRGVDGKRPGRWMRMGGLVAWSVGLLALPLACWGATAEKAKKKATDSGPVLMSKTGGGAWSDLKELQAAAANGNPKAEAQLGEMLLRGDRVTKDEARAVALLEKAARAGNSSAAFRIGMLLTDGESGVAKDPARALGYFRAAAAGGEKEAFFNIGAAYGSAKGVKRDYGEALAWLIVARQRGADASAENELRARIKAQPSWIARGERRAKEIEQEFAGKTVADFLPPVASLAVPATTELAPTVPEGPGRPTGELTPAIRRQADDALKPALPALPPPSIPRP